MPRKVNIEDLKKELKAAKEELSYYRHKTAYFEAFNEVLLEDAGEGKKASKKKIPCDCLIKGRGREKARESPVRHS